MRLGIQVRTYGLKVRTLTESLWLMRLEIQVRAYGLKVRTLTENLYSSPIFTLYIFYLYFHCYYVIQTYILFFANNLILLMTIDTP